MNQKAKPQIGLYKQFAKFQYVKISVMGEKLTLLSLDVALWCMLIFYIRNWLELPY